MDIPPGYERDSLILIQGVLRKLVSAPAAVSRIRRGFWGWCWRNGGNFVAAAQGAEEGAAAGSLLFPGIGTAVGGVVGAAAGWYAGEYLGPTLWPSGG